MENPAELIPYLVLLVAFGFFFYTQQKKSKEQRNMLASISEGDEVVLNSGIHGFVASVEENIIWVEVSEGTELKVSLSAVSSVVSLNISPVGEEA